MIASITTIAPKKLPITGKDKIETWVQQYCIRAINQIQRGSTESQIHTRSVLFSCSRFEDKEV